VNVTGKKTEFASCSVLAFCYRTSEGFEQLKSGLSGLLDQLQPEDRFNVVAYSSSLHHWSNSRESVVSATAANVASAKSFIASLAPSSGQFVELTLTTEIAIFRMR